MKWLCVGLVATSACMAAADEPTVPIYGSVPGSRCNATQTQSLVGQSVSARLGARALRLTGARALRWIRPGQAVTMDYREDRLNVELDERGAVRALRCG